MGVHHRRRSASSAVPAGGFGGAFGGGGPLNGAVAGVSDATAVGRQTQSAAVEARIRRSAPVHSADIAAQSVPVRLPPIQSTFVRFPSGPFMPESADRSSSRVRFVATASATSGSTTVGH